MTDRQSASMADIEPVVIARIQSRLRSLGLSSFDVSRKLGKHQNFIQDLCIGRKKSFSAMNVPSVAEVLQCDPEYLLGVQETVRRSGVPVEPRFKRGDVVSLNSGGALMTVKRPRPRWSPVTGEETMWVQCVWLDAVGNVHTDDFEDWLLKKEARESA